MKIFHTEILHFQDVVFAIEPHPLVWGTMLLNGYNT